MTIIDIEQLEICKKILLRAVGNVDEVYFKRDAKVIVSVDQMNDILQHVGLTICTSNENKPVKKFLFVEDGSIDLDLVEVLGARNPEIKVVVYRQGSSRPQLVDIRTGKIE